MPAMNVGLNYNNRNDTLFNSSTPTPQYDPPNMSYFDSKFNYIPHNLQQQQQPQQQQMNNNNLSYSTLFGDANSSTILSPQFSNNSSTPVHFNIDNKQPMNYNNANTNNNSYIYQLPYQVVNNPIELQNANALPTSSFVDKDQTLDDDFDISDLSELRFVGSRAESPSPSPNSSPKKSIYPQNQNPSNLSAKNPITVQQKSKHKQKEKPGKEKEKLTFASPHPQFTPTLNLSNMKYNKVSIESPHTPLGQQNINHLLTVNNNNKGIADDIIEPVTPLNVTQNAGNSDDFFKEDDDLSYTSPSSSSFPSPSIPSLPLYGSEEKEFQHTNNIIDTDKIATKSRILHFIHHIITRHNIIYRTYLVSVPSQTPENVLLDLIETIFYPLGIIKSVIKVPGAETGEGNHDDDKGKDSGNAPTELAIDSSLFSKFRVTISVADSGLTTYSNPNNFNTASNSFSRHGRFSNNEKDNQAQQQQQQQSQQQQPQHSGPWKSIKYTLDGRDVKMLIFYESDSKEYLGATPLSAEDKLKDLQVFSNSDDEVMKSAIANAQSSMSKSLTTNNKLDVCWYPEGFSSTFHRRGVNNFMFVRELQSKMIVNRTRVSGGGIIEMGEFRVSVPIEEIGFLGENSNNAKINANGTGGTATISGERLKRSFLVNIDLRELDGKNLSNNNNNNNGSHTHTDTNSTSTHTNGGGNATNSRKSNSNSNSNNGGPNAAMSARSSSFSGSVDQSMEKEGGANSSATLNSGSSSNSGNNNAERTGHGHHNHSYNYSNNAGHAQGNRYATDSSGAGSLNASQSQNQSPNPMQSSNAFASQDAVDAGGNGRGRGGKLGKKREGRGGFRYGNRRGGGGNGSGRGSFRGKHMATHT